MEAVLLNLLGGQSPLPQIARPLISLATLDDRVRHLQMNAIDSGTAKTYATGTCDYIKFCLLFNLPLTPTPVTLSRYIAYTSSAIVSAPKYLSGARHFLKDIYPEFDESRSHPLVQTTI